MCVKVCVCERERDVKRTVLFIVDLECPNPKTDSRRRKRSMTLYSVKECQHAAPLTNAEKNVLSPPPEKVVSSEIIKNRYYYSIIFKFVLSQARVRTRFFSFFL